MTFVSSGDSEIDQVRRAVQSVPTTGADYPYRIAMLATWINLLQRQGADLSAFAAVHDRLKAGLDHTGVCAAIDEGFALLAGVQAALDATALDAIPGSATSSPPPPGADWPVYGGNIHHTGSTDEPGPTQGAIAWQQPVGLAWYVRPAVQEGRVYVTSPGMRGMLHCLALDSGAVIWKTRRTWTENDLGTINLLPNAYVTPTAASTPLVLADTVVLNAFGAQGRAQGARHLTVIDKATGDVVQRIPAGQADYRMGYVSLVGDEDYLLFATGTQRIQEAPPQAISPHRMVCIQKSTGETLWDFHIGLTFCDPLLDGDRVYVGTAAGAFYALNITGASRREHFGFSDQRRIAWQFQAGGAANSPAVTDAERVYFGSNDGVITCLDKASGALIWQTPVDEREPRAFKLFSRPALGDGRVYIGAAARRLYCLDAEDGALLWSVETPDWVRAQPAIRGDRVFVAALDGSVTCLRDAGATAELVWRVACGEHPIFADLVCAQGKVLVSASDLSLWCLDSADGSLSWQHHALDCAVINGRTFRADEMASGGWYQSKPTAADGKVFVGTPSRFVKAFDHASGAELWRFEMGGAVSGAPAYADGRVFIGQQGGEDDFYCLDAQTGQRIWKQALGWVWSSANVADGRVFVAGVDGYATCLDGQRGHIIWRQRTPRGLYPEPPIDQGRVFFGSWDHFAYAFDTSSGDLLWQFHTGGSPDSGAPIAHQGRLYLPTGGTRIRCLDAATGSVIWVYELEGHGCMNASPALWNDRLFISVSVRAGAIPIASRIRCLDAQTGEPLWEHPGGGITGPSVAGGKVYFASTSDPFFYCVDAAGNDDGTTTCLWRCTLGERVFESVPALYGGRVFILSEHGYLSAVK